MLNNIVLFIILGNSLVTLVGMLIGMVVFRVIHWWEYRGTGAMVNEMFYSRLFKND